MQKRMMVTVGTMIVTDRFASTIVRVSRKMKLMFRKPCVNSSRAPKGPPEYCQDGTVTHLNYDRLL